MAIKYCVGGMGTIDNGSGSVVGAPIRLVVGLNNISIFSAGTFTVYIPQGLTGVVASDIATVTDSPVNLTVGAGTIINVTGTGNIKITLAINLSNSFYSSTATWSNTSGGIPGAAVPDITDDVFFDVNSFSANNQVIQVATGNSTTRCRDMNWTGATGNPVFYYGDNNNGTHIFGSATFIAAMSVTYYNTAMSFDGSGTIKTNGLNISPFGTNMCAINGQYTLSDTMTLGNGRFRFYIAGNLDLNGFDLVVTSTPNGQWSGLVFGNGATILGNGVVRLRGTANCTMVSNLLIPNLSLEGASHVIVCSVNNSTINNFSMLPNVTQTLYLSSGYTLNVGNMKLGGSSTNRHTILSTVPDKSAIINRGVGSIQADFCNITDIQVDPQTYGYYGSNSTVKGNSPGWTKMNKACNSNLII